MPIVSGFCDTGSHEGTARLSPGGSLLVPCKQTYHVHSGHKILTFVCTCDCHKDFNEIRQMMAMMKATHDGNDAILDAPILQEIPAPTVGGTSGVTPVTATPAPFAPVVGTSLRPTIPAKPVEKTFDPTPTGRAARGQLEEKVRIVVAQLHELAAGMLTPKMIAGRINKDSPPSQGAVHAVLIRWEQRGLVELAKNPFRFEKFTDLGKRQLLH